MIKCKPLFIIISVALTVMALLLFVGVGTSVTMAEADTPTAISLDKDGLIALSQEVSNGDNKLGKNYVLGADVDLTGVEFAPIGTDLVRFQGNIDGNGKKITLSQSVTGSVAGVFGYLGSSGGVRNLIVDGTIDATGDNVGGLVAYNEGVVSACVSLVQVSGNKKVGGIVGDNRGSVISCVNVGKVAGNENVGGIVGISSATATINGCVNAGEIVNSLSTVVLNVGGLVGKNASLIKNSYSIGEISITANNVTNVGSIVGYLERLNASTFNNYAIDNTTYIEIGYSVVGGYEQAFLQKSKEQLLHSDGFAFESDLFARADYKQGYGYAYLPTFIVQEGAFVNNYEFLEEVFILSLFEDGVGEEQNPFIINSKEQWLLFAVNAGIFSYENTFIKLNSNVDVGEVSSISNGNVAFSGEIDGNNKAVTFSIVSDTENVGLFAKTGEGTVIKNLTLNGSVTGTSATGALIGLAQGNTTINNVVQNCTVSGAIATGGVVGKSTSILSLDSVVNNGNVTGSSRTGGIVGDAESGVIISKAYNYGTVSSFVNGAEGVGGIVGYVDVKDGSATFSFIHNEGTIVSAKATGVAGICGKFIGSTVASNFNVVSNAKAITGRYSVGGIIGASSGVIEITSFNVVSSHKAVDNAGGIIGLNAGSVTLTNGYFVGYFIEDTTVSKTGEYKTDVIANGGTVSISATYYNVDVNNGGNIIGATPYTSVKLSDGTLFDGVENWDNKEKEITKGYYSLVNATAIKSLIPYTVIYFDKTDTDGYYVLSSKQALENFIELANGYAGYNTYNYRLGLDIKVNSSIESLDEYSGSFDGNGYEIIGATLTNGLFGTLKTGATINRLGIIDGEISSSSTNVGGIADMVENGATITNCYTDMYITITNESIAGGIAGTNFGEISTSFALGKISAKKVGGITGINDKEGIITDCFFNGYADATTLAGGIAGENFGGITRCYVNGRIEGNNVGGIAENFTQGQISYSIVYAELVGSAYGLFGNSISSQISVENCFYLSTINETVTAYVSVVDNTAFAKSIDEMRANTFVINGYSRFVNMYNDEYDAYYGCYLNAIATLGENNDYVLNAYKQSVELKIFGSDTSSDYDYGSENNPYIISNANEFAIIGILSLKTNYYNRFFRIENDVDLSTVTINAGNVYPIGYFESTSSTNNIAFEGVMYGKDGLSIPKITNVNITTNNNLSKNYIGVFGYVGKNFSLSNVAFYGNVSGEKYVGSIVGYTVGGVIDDVYSEINVTASVSNAGGLVGSSSGNMQITDSVYNGLVYSPLYCYGIIGVTASSITLDTTNTWFIYNDEDYPNYLHNGYGSRLNVHASTFDNGSVSVAKRNVDDGFGFSILAENDFVGYVMNINDEWISDKDEVYYPIDGISVSSGQSVIYHVRFCKKINVLVNGVDDSDIATATISGIGYYYYGQKVKISLEWKGNGYQFMDLIDANSNSVSGYNLSNVAKNLNVEFVMNENTNTVSIETEKILSTNGNEDDIIAYASSNEYDGSEKIETVNLDYYALEYHYEDSGMASNTLVKVGTYVVTVKVLNSSDVIIGIYRDTYTISPKSITLNPSADMSDFAIKTYDGTNVKTITVSTQEYGEYFSGTISNESIDITFTATFADVNVGTSIGVVLSNFSVKDNDNYTITVADINCDNGEIIKNEMIITIEEALLNDSGLYVLEYEYDGEKPTISGAYAIDLTWQLDKLNIDLDLDTTWNESAGYGVGIYALTPIAKNEIDKHNYALSLANKYYVVINEYVITSVKYSNVNNLVYTGEILSNKISAYFVGVDNANYSVDINYYKVKTVDGGQEVEGETYFLNDSVIDLYENDNYVNGLTYLYKVDEIKRAGVYYAEAINNNANYNVLTVCAQRVVVEKSVLGGDIIFDVELNGVSNVSEIQIGNELEIIFTDAVSIHEDYDAKINVEIINTTRGNFVVEKRNDKTYLIPTAYGDEINYRLTATSATDYEDRVSEIKTIKVTPSLLYVGLERTEYVYGENINFNLKYYRDENKQTEVPVEEITGLRAPVVQTGEENYDAKNYTLIYSGGESDGYTFKFLEKEIVINRREIIIVVATSSSKIYGDGINSNIDYVEEKISYTIVEEVDGNRKELVDLPNGEKVVLLGKLSREAGESVGKYAVNQGTLTEENNPNYKITMDSVLEDFVITKRDIALEIVEGQGREYGEMTQENERYQLAVSQEYLKYLVKDVSLGINDDASIFNDAVIVSREEGEDFGSYKYSVTYEEDELSLLNYNIIEVKISDEYFIYKMTPSLSITLTGTVYYGDSIESLQYSAQATCGTEKVSGRYTMNLLHGNDSLKLTDKVVNVSFVPDSANFNSARTSISISVMPRPVTVDIYTKIAEGFGLANGAILPYIGKNYTSSDFTYVANNVIEGDELMVSLSINGDAKNVTKDGFTVSASIESELYVLANTNSVTCTITQALVTVTVENTSIKQGEEYVPTITYDGFLGGDKEKDLIEKAKVENIPTTSGYHSIIAKGAKSNNYVFTYISGQLIIEGTKLNDNDVVINGSFSPIITMSSVTHKQGSGAFLAVSESIDKTLGNSILSPLSQQMVQVVEISTNMALSEECTYVVKLSALNSGDTVYVRTADGKVNALEYEIVDETDGVTISFKALNATGVAVYGNKGIGDVILGYWLYMAIAGVVLIIIVIIIIVKFAKRKSKKTDESYVVKGHWR